MGWLGATLTEQSKSISKDHFYLGSIKIVRRDEIANDRAKSHFVSFLPIRLNGVELTKYDVYPLMINTFGLGSNTLPSFSTSCSNMEDEQARCT